MVLNKIDKSSILKLCSGQVVLDLSSIVKELVENSIDAKATVVEIKFKEFGVKSVEVIDNGNGIDEQDLDCIGFRNYTSKIEDWTDLSQLSSLGFRGEALNSIATLAKLTLFTSTSETAPKGFKVDLSSEIRNKVVCHRMQGTTFKVENLFYSLPVRLNQLAKNSKKEFTKTVALLQAFALTYPEVQFKVTNTDKKNMTNNIFLTHSGGGLLNQFSTLFGNEASKQMLPIDFTVPLPNSDSITITGLISQPSNNGGASTGRSSTDRQFLAINDRICNLPKFVKNVNDIFKQYAQNKYPTFVLKLQVSFDRVDVNLTPDKRTVMLHDESDLIREFKAYLIKLFQDTLGLVPVNQISSSSAQSTVVPTKKLKEDSKESSSITSNLVKEDKLELKREELTSQNETCEVREEANPLNVNVQVAAINILHENKPEPALESEDQLDTSAETNFEAPVKKVRLQELITESSPAITNSTTATTTELSETELNSNLGQSGTEDSEIQSSNLVATWSLEVLQQIYATPTTTDTILEVSTDPAEINPKLEVTNLAPISGQTTDSQQQIEAEPTTVSIQLDSQKDFPRMSIVGQFNLGFLVVKLDSNLYLIDQHAADEIFNYEKFKRQHAQSQSRQPLVQPKQLHLSVCDELVALEHLDLLTQIGYHIEVVEDRNPGSRLNLLSLPTTASVTLDLNELERILYQLSLHPTTVTPTSSTSQSSSQTSNLAALPLDLAAKGSQLDSKLASLACRSSVMIGDHLDLKSMGRIVKNLATLNRPYNCPHGRPTIRHLCKLE